MSKSIIITEQQVLACFLNDPALLEKETECYFQNDVAVIIFKALLRIYKEHGDFLPSTIVALCNSEDIDANLVISLKENVTFDLTSFDFYKRRLIEEYVKSKLLTTTIKKATETLLAKGELNIGMLDSVVADIQKAKNLIEHKSELLTFNVLLSEYEQNLRTLGQGIHFVPTGCHHLDNLLYGKGFELGQLSTIFGNPGNGKSIFAEKLINGKINRKEPVLYVPTEMGRMSTTDRLVAMRTGLTLGELTTVDEATLEVPEYVVEEFLIEKRKLEKNSNFRILDTAGLSVQDIENAGNELKKDLGINYLSIYIDLGSMLTDFSGDGKASKYEDAMNDLFYVAKANNFAIIPVFQTRRKESITVQNYADCKKFAPSILELKNSGAIEERCRVVLSIFRQKFYGERTLGKEDPEVMIADDIMDVSIQKQNNGPLNTLHYLYQGECGRLTYFKEDENE